MVKEGETSKNARCASTATACDAADSDDVVVSIGDFMDEEGVCAKHRHDCEQRRSVCDSHGTPANNALGLTFHNVCWRAPSKNVRGDNTWRSRLRRGSGAGHGESSRSYDVAVSETGDQLQRANGEGALSRSSSKASSRLGAVLQRGRRSSKSENGGRLILDNVSGAVHPGEVLAVLGPSGAGKTTLFNVVCGRLPPSSGDVLLDGSEITKRSRKKIGFVMQADVLFANLTVRETMRYAAQFRLPSSLTHKEKVAKAEEMLELLGLTSCADSLVGNDNHRGISGGEKKRLNIGSELLGDPPVLVLDEPTSGLDSATATALIATLRRLASTQHRTVLMTVHQPSSQMYAQFDKLLLLAKGKVAFFGSPSDAESAFQAAGFSCPPNYNIADYYLDVLANAESCKRYFAYLGESAATRERAQLRPALVKENRHLVDGSHSSVAREPAHLLSFWAQVALLISRGYKQHKGELWTKYNFFQAIALSITAGLAWFQLPNTEASLNDRFGFIFFAIIFWSLRTILSATHAFPPERAVIRKEYASGAYDLSAYLLAKSISEMPVVLLLPAIYWTISFNMAGLVGAGRFFLSLLILLYSIFAAHSIGLFFSALFMDVKKAAATSTVILLTSMFLAGFYVQTLPSWLTWSKYFSYMHYTYSAELALEFQLPTKFACDTIRSAFDVCAPIQDSAQPQNGTASQDVFLITGQDVLDRYGIDTSFTHNMLGIAAFIIVFRFATYFALLRTLTIQTDRI